MVEPSKLSHEAVVLAWLLGKSEILDEAGVDAEKWLDDATAEFYYMSLPVDWLSETKWPTFRSDQDKLFVLLRDCILTHRWHEALKVGATILDRNKDLKNCVLPIRRTMPEAVLQTSDKRGEAFYDFMRLTKATLGNSRVPAYEVNINMMIKYLTDGNLAGAQNIVEGGVRNKQGLVGGEQCEHYKHLFTLYEGLLWYSEWHKEKRKKEEEESEDEMLVDNSSPMDESMKIQAAKAIQCFTVLKKSLRGVWDIFITRYTTLLEYYDQDETALDLLEQYQAKNPDNPNTEIYLYDYHKRHHASSDRLIEILERIVRQTPSLPIALELCEKYELKGNKDKSIPVLFNMLDHVCWKDEVKPWTLLADVLLDLSNEGDNEAISRLEECWKERKDWWLLYHFNITPDDTDHNRVVHKAIVCTLLLGKDCRFVHSMLEKDMQDSLKDKLLEACEGQLCDIAVEMNVRPPDQVAAFHVFKL